MNGLRRQAFGRIVEAVLSGLRPKRHGQRQRKLSDLRDKGVHGTEREGLAFIGRHVEHPLDAVVDGRLFDAGDAACLSPAAGGLALKARLLLLGETLVDGRLFRRKVVPGGRLNRLVRLVVVHHVLELRLDARLGLLFGEHVLANVASRLQAGLSACAHAALLAHRAPEEEGNDHQGGHDKNDLSLTHLNYVRLCGRPTRAQLLLIVRTFDGFATTRVRDAEPQASVRHADRVLDVDAHDAAHAGLLHRYAHKRSRELHRHAMMRDHEELRLARHAAAQTCKPRLIGLVKGCIHFVKQAEGSGIEA